MLKKVSLFSFVAVLLAGCASNKGSLVSPEEFAKTAMVRQEARMLRAGDEVHLAVEVNGKKEIPSTQMVLDYTGAVAAPFVGDVKVEGMTLVAARAELEKKYAKIFVTVPLITFRLADNADVGEWGFITVLGQVRAPGRFPVSTIAGMNLSEALHEAGGFGESANMNAIVVTRKLASGASVQCESDIKEFGRAGSSQQDLVLFDGDVVYVPERLF